MLELLGRAKAKPFAASFDTAAATDGSSYPRSPSWSAAYSTLNGELSAAVSEAPAAQLDGPLPGAGLHDERKVFDTLLFFRGTRRITWAPLAPSGRIWAARPSQ